MKLDDVDSTNHVYMTKRALNENGCLSAGVYLTSINTTMW